MVNSLITFESGNLNGDDDPIKAEHYFLLKMAHMRFNKSRQIGSKIRMMAIIANPYIQWAPLK